MVFQQGVHLGKAPHTKNPTQSFWLLPDTLCHTWREAQGLLHTQLWQAQPRQAAVLGEDTLD